MYSFRSFAVANTFTSCSPPSWSVTRAKYNFIHYLLQVVKDLVDFSTGMHIIAYPTFKRYPQFLDTT